MEKQVTITFQGKEYIDCTPVEPGCECPGCGENREDRLVLENGWGVCSTCGWVYKP